MMRRNECRERFNSPGSNSNNKYSFKKSRLKNRRSMKKLKQHNAF